MSSSSTTMAEASTPNAEPVPGTPCISELRFDKGCVSESLGLGPKCGESGDVTPGPGIRRVNFRAVIDTNPPFGSVKEAVTRFGGSGPWIPFCKQGTDEFDIKRMEEQTAELEKDLIVKELETLDVLEELGATKKMVEELKRQLQTEALRCFTRDEQRPSIPTAEEMDETFADFFENRELMLGNSSPCPMSSPDMILMELKQAKMSLGKTINDLGIIQTSVESLNRKMKRGKTLLAKRREGVLPKFRGDSTLDEELKQVHVKFQESDNVEFFKDVSENSVIMSRELRLPEMNLNGGQIKNVNEMNPNCFVGVAGNEYVKTSLKTAELRLLAARKMEEAAKAAEAVALAEVEALTNYENSSGFSLQDPETMAFNFKEQTLLNSKTQKPPQKNDDMMAKFDEANSSKLAIAKKLKEAKEELKLGKQALEEALNRVELANRKQLVAEETLQRWLPEHKENSLFISTPLHKFLPSVHQGSPLNSSKNRPNLVNNNSKPVLRSTISMRDVLSRKQMFSEEHHTATAKRDNRTEKQQKVALSQMLHALKEDLTFPTKTENVRNDQKSISTERKRFGFIHISLPMKKASKKEKATTIN